MNDVKVERLNRLEQYIVDYEAKEAPTGKIVFYGDSSFTRWSESHHMRAMEDEIRMKDGTQAVVNRGFGTSTAEEQLYYYPRMIRPLKPRALVVQTYGNDCDSNYTPEEILALQSRLFAYARTDFPGIKIYVCNVRPLLGPMKEKDLWFENLSQYNRLLEEYCDKHSDVTLIDHRRCSALFADLEHSGDYTKLQEDIFVSDEVHYNQKGYDIYREFFLEELKELL